MFSHPQSGDSQGQETFLAPSADKQTRNYDTRVCIYIYIYIVIRLWKHIGSILLYYNFGVNVWRWCPFVYLFDFDIPFQNSPCGHALYPIISKAQNALQVSLRQPEEFFYFIVDETVGNDK